MNGFSPREKILIWVAVILSGLVLIAGAIGTVQEAERRDQQFHNGVRR